MSYVRYEDPQRDSGTNCIFLSDSQEIERYNEWLLILEEDHTIPLRIETAERAIPRSRVIEVEP